MIRFGLKFLAAALVAAYSAGAAETNATPDFKEVYELLRTHLTGATDSDLNRAAVEGLLTNLHGKATLVANGTATAQTNVALVAKSMVLESEVGYVRVGRVAEGLASAVSTAVRELGATNQLKGLVLDLRFAQGDSYAAAAAVADLFVADPKPLLDWGEGVVKAEKKFDIINLPVAVLVNRETGGAAEALAAVLRESGVGLLLGGPTAGSAMISQEFPLQTGQRLRIGTQPVKLGTGTALSPNGVQPDIAVAVKSGDERLYFENPYAQLGRSNLVAAVGPTGTNQIAGTNRPARRPRATEADLVRARRNGTSLDEESVFVRDTEPEKPLIRDPVLARAVDLLKALAVVRHSRP